MFGGATAGGFQPGPTTGNTGTTGGSGGGGGDGLTESQVQTLIDTSLSGAVAPSSVTTSGQIKANQGFSFDTSPFPDGSESSLERESNGGMLLKRGGTTFLTLSPFTGAIFGVNLTAGNLTVNGTFTPSGGISGVYTSSQTDTLLADKQPLLSDQAGTGVTLKSGDSLRRIFGQGGCVVTIPLNLEDPNDPQNFQVKVDTSSLQTSLSAKADASTVTALQSTVASKQDAITSSSSVSVGTLTAATEVVADTIKAPSGSGVLLGNSAGTGLTVASNGAVGVLKTVPSEALDVYGNGAISGTLMVGSSATPWDIFEDGVGDLYIKKGSEHFIGFGASSSPSTIYFLVATASYSDQRLKDDVEDLDDADCLGLLRSVSAKTYVRNDLGSERRCGFIAQDVEAAAPASLGSNLWGESTREIDGQTDTIKTLSYERMSVVLWQCCRSMLARIEALEAAAAP